jgi:hypothetical protein
MCPVLLGPKNLRHCVSVAACTTGAEFVTAVTLATETAALPETGSQGGWAAEGLTPYTCSMKSVSKISHGSQLGQCHCKSWHVALQVTKFYDSYNIYYQLIKSKCLSELTRMAYRLMTISNGFNGYVPSKMATIGKYAIFSAFSTDTNGYFGPKSAGVVVHDGCSKLYQQVCMYHVSNRARNQRMIPIIQQQNAGGQFLFRLED